MKAVHMMQTPSSSRLYWCVLVACLIITILWLKGNNTILVESVMDAKRSILHVKKLVMDTKQGKEHAENCAMDVKRSIQRIDGPALEVNSDRQHVNETQLFSFMKPGLTNCDELFKEKAAFNLEAPSIYNRLKPEIKVVWDHWVARKAWVEGHSGLNEKQTLAYFTLAKASFVKTVCETGFNAGHSALAFLSTNADLHYYSFDLGLHPYGRPIAKLLQKNFPDRLNVTWGDSKKTVPAFIKDNPELKCDIVIVDGGHGYREAKADLRNLRALANKSYHVLISDDIQAIPSVKKAWREELSSNQLKQHFSCISATRTNKGITIGQYINL